MDSYNNTDQNVFVKAIISALLIITVLLIPIKVIILQDVCDFLKADKCTDILMTIFAAITLYYTYSQYNAYLKREKAEVLGKYNERYSTDEHINKVVEYIIRYIDKEKTTNLPSVHNAEMFMRFFEEMQIQIENKRLDEGQVYRLFAYYAIVLDADEILRSNLGVVDYLKDTKTWEGFRTFVSNMFMKYYLPETEWECDLGNAISKRIVFMTSDVKCITKNGVNEESEIVYFSYNHGVVKIGDMDFQFKPSGTNDPDQLKCINSNCFYLKVKK